MPSASPLTTGQTASDASGKGVAGVKVVVTWAEGSDTFYTGMYPEINAGYADFKMKDGVEYSVQAGDAGEVITPLMAGKCSFADGSPYSGGWRVYIYQP